MFLNQYCTELEAGHFSFSRQQSSTFAKQIANDFNPIHDVDSKRFCVPGDLLFAKILMSEGLHNDMQVNFSGMVSDGVELEIQAQENGRKVIADGRGKEYLSIDSEGEQNLDPTLIEKLVRSYVAFSGENFPHVLVPLMKDKNAMINPARPLVIYESMSVHLDTVDLTDPVLEATEAELAIDGKRGNVTLSFIFKDNGQVVGKGKKTVVLSSLREYQQDSIDTMVAEYNQRKAQFAA
ncbi:DUF3581 family protein [Endozoicomonadaceae bacterium StTr2]